jgi:hypothetical protein
MKKSVIFLLLVKSKFTFANRKFALGAAFSHAAAFALAGAEAKGWAHRPSKSKGWEREHRPSQPQLMLRGAPAAVRGKALQLQQGMQQTIAPLLRVAPPLEGGGNKQLLQGRSLQAKEATKSKSSDVIYEYLKTDSKYSNKKNGVLLKYNQHIAYNFKKKNIKLRGVEPLTNNTLNLKTNKNTYTSADLFIENAKENLNKNIIKHINNVLNKPLGTLYPKYSQLYPPFSNSKTQIKVDPNRLKRVETYTYISKNLLLRLNRLNDVRGKIAYQRPGTNRVIKNSYKLLLSFFKSMYCLISKPVFIFSPDKVVIQLLYFLSIPKFKVFKWYAIVKNKLIRKIKTREYSPKYKFHKIKRKVARTLVRLNKKRSRVQKTLFNLNKYNLFKVFSSKFKIFCEIFNKKYKKPVELQLIRIHKPFHDSNILVNLLSLNIRNKKFKTNVKIAKLFQKRVVKNVSNYQNKSVNFIPSYLSGINIRIGGRLMREVMIPRISKKIFERGARSIGKVNYLDSASITNKNRKGSYTLKISSGQNFF